MKDKTDQYIKELLKGVKPESPSNDFTNNVMNQIITEEKPVFETKASFLKKNKFLIIFSVIFISIYIIVFFFSDSQEPTVMDKFNFDPSKLSFIEKLRDFFSVDIQFSSTYLIIIVSIFMLFSLDYFIPKISKMQNDALPIL